VQIRMLDFDTYEIQHDRGWHPCGVFVQRTVGFGGVAMAHRYSVNRSIKPMVTKAVTKDMDRLKEWCETQPSGVVGG